MCHDVPAGKESVVRCDVPMQHVWGDSSTHARCIGVGSTTLYFFMDPINYHTHTLERLSFQPSVTFVMVVVCNLDAQKHPDRVLVKV
jgi:hypothetical protein